MIRRPPRSTLSSSSAASDVYKRQVLPLYSVLYNVNLFNPGLMLVILLGSVGYIAIGTLLAAMAVQTRTRDVMLPILLFPVVIPVVVAAVEASGGFLQGMAISELMYWINLL